MKIQSQIILKIEGLQEVLTILSHPTYKKKFNLHHQK